MKERQKQTGRQAERTLKELKELRKLDRSIFKPAKNPLPLDKPQIVVISKNVNSSKRTKKSSAKTDQSKRRQRPKISGIKQHHDEAENQSEPVSFTQIIARMLHTFIEREPMLTLKTLQNFGIMVVFIVALIAGSTLMIFHDKGEQVLEFIAAGDHQHSEASRVVVDSGQKKP